MMKLILLFLFCSNLIIPKVDNYIVSKFDESIIKRSLKLDSSFSQIKFFNDRFFAVNDNEIDCIDFFGNRIWKHEILDSLNSNIIVVENKVVFLNANYDLVCLDSETGKVNESIGIDIEAKAFLVSFNYIGSNELIIPKGTNSTDAILIFFSNGKIICLDLETLQEYWRKDYLYEFVTEPKIINSKIIIGMKSGFINLIDANNGVLLWQWKEKEIFNISNTNFLTDGKSIFFLDSQGILYCLNSLLGKLNWKIENIKFLFMELFCEQNKFLLAQIANYNLVQVDLSKGKILKEIKLDKEIKQKVTNAFQLKEKIYLISGENIFLYHKNSMTNYFSCADLIKECILTKDDNLLLKDSKNNFIELELR